MMKKMIYAGAILVSAMLATTGLAQDTTTKTDTKMQMSGKKNPDSKFMMTLATGGMNEIALSRTALIKSTNEEVKTFAQKMVDDHTMAGDELKTLAAAKNVSLPMEPDSKHKALNDKLAEMNGAAFDMEYMKAMVKDHEATVALLQKESANGKDADAKALAAKLLPTVEGHLTMAKTMMSKMSGKKMDNKMSGM